MDSFSVRVILGFSMDKVCLDQFEQNILDIPEGQWNVSVHNLIYHLDLWTNFVKHNHD